MENNSSDSGKKTSRSSNKDDIWVNEFTEKSALKFREQVMEQVSAYDSNKPIVIRIDSYGGLVDSLASMIETIDCIPNPIITSCEGKSMSCGAILLSHGDYRFCGRHSRILIHEISGGSIGDVHDVHNDASEMKRLNTYFLGLLAKNCGIKGGYNAFRKIMKSYDGRDIYLDAHKALDFGIVDEIGVPTVVPIVQYQIGSRGYHSYSIDGGKGKKKMTRKTKKKRK